MNYSYISLRKVKHCDLYVFHVFMAVCTTLTAGVKEGKASRRKVRSGQVRVAGRWSLNTGLWSREAEFVFIYCILHLLKTFLLYFIIIINIFWNKKDTKKNKKNNKDNNNIIHKIP